MNSKYPGWIVFFWRRNRIGGVEYPPEGEGFTSFQRAPTARDAVDMAQIADEAIYGKDTFVARRVIVHESDGAV